MATTPDTPKLLPVEAWFQPADDGGANFQSPFVADTGTVFGVGPRTSFNFEIQTSRNLDPNAPPIELKRHFNPDSGMAFLRFLGSQGPATPHFELNFTDARVSTDLGPEGWPDPLAEALVDPDLVIFATTGSIALRGGLLTPPDAPKEPRSYTSRLLDAAAYARASLASCNPQTDLDGRPAGPAERAVAAVGDKVREMGTGPAPAHEAQQMFADMIYCSTLGWLMLERSGELVHDQWKENKSLTTMISWALPGELFDFTRLLNVAGIPESKIAVNFVTPSVEKNQTYWHYQRCMERGGIPPELIA